MVCNCPNSNCVRHGDCDACTGHHRGKRKDTYCRRKKGKKPKTAVLTTIVLLTVSLFAVIITVSTRQIVANRYKEVQEMPVGSIDMKQVQDGLYSGSFTYGKNRYDVQVTTENNRIETIVLQVETKDANRKYIKKAAVVVDEIIRNQTLQVDSVSGATRSSKAILKAVENALTNHPVSVSGPVYRITVLSTGISSPGLTSTTSSGGAAVPVFKVAAGGRASFPRPVCEKVNPTAIPGR